MLLLTLSEGGWYWCCYLLLVRVAGIMLLLTLEGGWYWCWYWYWCCYLLLVRVAGIGVVTYS